MQFLPEKTRMYYPSCDRYGTFLYFDSTYMATQFRYNGNFGPYTATTKFKDSLDKIVLIMNLPITEPSVLKDWQQVYGTSDITIDNQERYQIYVYKQHKKDAPLEPVPLALPSARPASMASMTCCAPANFSGSTFRPASLK